MMKLGIIANSIATLLLAATSLLPMVVHAQEAGAEAQMEPVDPALEEERAKVREELQQREADHAQQRQLICDQARAEIARLKDVPPNSVMRPSEDGSASRMTEAEHAEHMATLHKSEAENCQ